MSDTSNQYDPRSGAGVQKEMRSPEISTSMVGVSGILESNGIIIDDYVKELNGINGVRVYEKMGNSSVLGVCLFLLRMSMLKLEWPIETKLAEDATDEDKETAEFYRDRLIEMIKNDMDITWDSVISDVCTAFQYGWGWFEVIDKQRNGKDIANPKQSSKYKDGLWGFRRIAFRRQNTLKEWAKDKEGYTTGMIQVDPNTGREFTIEKHNSVHIVPIYHADNPEGRSLLRICYDDWYNWSKIRTSEVNGIDRELNGFPHIQIPQQIFDKAAKGDTTATTTKNNFMSIAKSMKLNQQAGLVTASNPYVDKEGKYTNTKQIQVDLLSSQGSRSIDTDTVIKRYEKGLARAFLAQFLFMDNAGSHARTTVEASVFYNSIQSLADSIAEAFTNQLISRAYDFNGWNEDLPVVMRAGKVDPEDIKTISEVIKNLAQSGMPLFPDAQAENDIRQRVGLTERPLEFDDDGFSMGGAGDGGEPGGAE